MAAVILRADARHLPLPDASVDLIVTSPPYFGLRDYRDGDASLAGQIGSEATPQEYVSALLDCTREWVRVLKPSGSMFVNLGDKYAVVPQAWRTETDSRSWSHANEARPTVTPARQGGVRAKSLMGLPWRYALGCIDDLGLILRAEIIWDKPNGLPESVTDRVRRSHEQVFHFTRQPRYYSAVDEIRESADYNGGGTRRAQAEKYGKPFSETGLAASRFHAGDRSTNPLGKLPGSVWEIASQPLTVPAALGVDHFAAFPMELPRRIIAGWSPPGICTACGEGRRPVMDKVFRKKQESHWDRKAKRDGSEPDGNDRGFNGVGYPCGRYEVSRTGDETCGCGTVWKAGGVMPSTRPAVVADPFGGTGTTALVADALGRTGLSFDRSADYCRLARWRTTDPGERAKAHQVPKPPPVMDGQDALFP